MVSEFVSDAFDTCNLDQEDLRKEMEQLVLDKKEETVLEGTKQAFCYPSDVDHRKLLF